jgi:hypothetical protein
MPFSELSNRHFMMTFGETPPELAIPFSKVKTTGFACQTASLFTYLLLLPLSSPWVTLVVRA